MSLNAILVLASITYLFLRTLLCAVIVLGSLGCGIATHKTSWPRPLESPTPVPPVASAKQEPSEAIDRPTSKPYTGALSVFEDPKRGGEASGRPRDGNSRDK